MSVAKPTGKYWMLFFISSAIMILMLIFLREYFWLALPFVTLYFAKALNIM
jgi:hypothetical protein